MQIIDWIAIGVVLLSLVIGMMLGFGKLLKIFTGGIVGIIISVIVTYFFIGVVASWGFVQAIMGKLHTAMVNAENGFVNFLIKIGIEKVILAVALFIVVQILRVLIVRIIKSIVEIENPVIRAFNRIGGMIFLYLIQI